MTIFAEVWTYIDDFCVLQYFRLREQIYRGLIIPIKFPQGRPNVNGRTSQF